MNIHEQIKRSNNDYYMEHLISILILLSLLIPVFIGGGYLSEKCPRPFSYYLVSAQAFLATIGIILNLIASYNYPLAVSNPDYYVVTHTLPYSIAASAITAIILYLVLKSRNKLLSVYISAVLTYTASIILFTAGMTGFCNAFFDISAGKEYKATISDLEIFRGEGATKDYYIEFEIPELDNKSKILTNLSFYQSSKKGDRIMLIINPGLFNIPWISDYRHMRETHE